MKKELNNFQVVWRMIKLVKPLVLPMCLAIIMGVVGFLCAIGIPVLSAMALFQLIGMYPHIPYFITIFLTNFFSFVINIKRNNDRHYQICYQGNEHCQDMHMRKEFQ